MLIHEWSTEPPVALGQCCLFALIVIKTDTNSFISYWLKASSSKLDKNTTWPTQLIPEIQELLNNTKGKKSYNLAHGWFKRKKNLLIQFKIHSLKKKNRKKTGKPLNRNRWLLPSNYTICCPLDDSFVETKVNPQVSSVQILAVLLHFLMCYHGYLLRRYLPMLCTTELSNTWADKRWGAPQSLWPGRIYDETAMTHSGRRVAP